MNKVIFEAKGITKKYPGVRALDNVDLEVREGEVLSLVGENGAGKSTLMKVLLGETRPDGGSMTLCGVEHAPKSPHDALIRGISMIHQEIALNPHTTVAENVWQGRENQFLRWGLLSNKMRAAKTRELINKYSLPIDENSIVSTLSIAQMQMVEIARAISYNAKLIIMDEPTSSLTTSEVSLLVSIIRQLTSEKTAIIFISHKLEEVIELSDRIAVLRDGKRIGEQLNAKEVTYEQLIRLIVGRDIQEMYPKTPVEIGEVVLECRNLSRIGVFKNISFNLRKGEILGFSGLVGAGRTEVMRCLFGADPLTTGEIYLHGKRIYNRSPREAIKNSFGMLTEDRLHLGIFPKSPVLLNVSAASVDRFSKWGFLNANKEREEVQNLVDAMQVKTTSLETQMQTLSGGNQQKGLIARWLLAQSQILILDEPTRGIDVGSKTEIHKRIGELVSHGVSVILISSELPEVMGLSDRLIVMKNGRKIREFQRSEFSQEAIIDAAF